MTGAAGGDDERIALFLDYENLAIGARDGLGVSPFDFGPIADALADRGRVVARRAYADWSAFDEDRRLLARAQVELIEIPQRIGGSRKNAADIKLAVDAIELAYERSFVTTFAIGTGDSDFTPLVHKLRELDKRVIGIGVESSTSKLLPPSCDEFLFYDRLPGVEPGQPVRRGRRGGGYRSPARSGDTPGQAAPGDTTSTGAATGTSSTGTSSTGTAPAGTVPAGPDTRPSAPAPSSTEPRTSGLAAEVPVPPGRPGPAVFSSPFAVHAPVEQDAEEDTEQDVERLVTSTLTGLQRHAAGPVLASRVKRAILRKDPTFDEADHGFRGFGELMRHLAEGGVLELRPGAAQGDPEVTFPQDASADDQAFALLVDVVRELETPGERPQLSGLKDQLRKRQPEFSEKRYGFTTFLSFVKAARARGLLELELDVEAGEYLLHVPR